jgi:hypothetical protein
LRHGLRLLGQGIFSKTRCFRKTRHFEYSKIFAYKVMFLYATYNADKVHNK